MKKDGIAALLSLVALGIWIIGLVVWHVKSGPKVVKDPPAQTAKVTPTDKALPEPDPRPTCTWDKVHADGLFTAVTNCTSANGAIIGVVREKDGNTWSSYWYGAYCDGEGNGWASMAGAKACIERQGVRTIEAAPITPKPSAGKRTSVLPQTIECASGRPAITVLGGACDNPFGTWEWIIADNADDKTMIGAVSIFVTTDSWSAITITTSSGAAWHWQDDGSKEIRTFPPRTILKAIKIRADEWTVFREASVVK